MKAGSLKVVVSITEAYPTLLNVVGRMEDGLRSERLKILAMLGLQIENGLGGFTVSDGGRTRDANEDGITGNVRFAVVLNQGQPRLYRDIEATPTRLRAERLRSLATLGLQLERGGLGARAPASAFPRNVHSLDQLDPVMAKNLAPSQVVVTPSIQVKQDLPGGPPATGTRVGATPESDDAKSTVHDANAVGKKVRNFAKLLGGD